MPKTWKAIAGSFSRRTKTDLSELTLCHFITAVLPRSANHAALAEIAAKYRRALDPQSKASIEGQLQPGELYFLTTQGHCDCGTALGALRRSDTELERRNRNDEQKLRRKGWSEVKITRWKEHKAEHPSKPQTVFDATDWEKLLKEMLSSRHTAFVGLLLHWYEGPIDGRIQLKGRERIKMADLTADVLGRMREDVLYEFQQG